MTIQGLHHITLGCCDAQKSFDFYSGVLGLRLGKKTINFDDPGTYHLYFGDERGTPGSAITFFEWPGVPKGTPGIGGTHHLALQVTSRDALLKWKRRLTDLGVAVIGPHDQRYFSSILFSDPDGTLLELATLDPGWTIDEQVERLGETLQDPPHALVLGHRDERAIDDETWPEAVPEITADIALSRGMHHITAISSDLARTHAFYGDLLALRRVKMTADFDDPTSAHWYWGDPAGRPGTVISYYERDPRVARRARMGVGQTHHFALAVATDDEQRQWRERLIEAGLRVSPVMDRVYFHSIYSNDPDGHIVELATAGPGFGIDEDWSSLGTSLQLPPWLERHRSQIEAVLKPVHASEPAAARAR
jgi:glyoxalase family protein